MITSFPVYVYPDTAHSVWRASAPEWDYVTSLQRGEEQLADALLVACERVMVVHLPPARLVFSRPPA